MSGQHAWLIFDPFMDLGLTMGQFVQMIEIVSLF